MIFDDERREAAQSLKHYAHDQLQGGLLNTLKLATGIDGTWRDVLLRLADLIEPSCDRDELLEEVKELEKCAWYFGLDFDEDEPLRDRLKEASEAFSGSAHRIRKALGV